MKKLLILAMLALTACGTAQTAPTPQDRYFAVTQAVIVVAQAAETYVDTCHALPPDSSCRNVLPKINVATKGMLATLHVADLAFVTKDSTHYDLSLADAEKAVSALQALIGGK